MHHTRFVESLENRALMSAIGQPDYGDPTPADGARSARHIALANQLVVEVSPEDNSYDTPTQITWRGIDGASVSTNVSVCSSFITRLLKQAYGFTNANFIQWTGQSNPDAAAYYDAAEGNNGLRQVMNIADVQVGDVFIAKYLQVTDATGHIAMIAAAPQLVSSTSTERRYDVLVIDSSSSYHGTSDTRHRIDMSTGTYDEGVGEGMMRFVTDLSGHLIKYAWSNASGSTLYDATTRPSLLAQLPPHGGGVLNSSPAPTDPTPDSPFASGDSIGASDSANDSSPDGDASDLVDQV